MLGLFQEKVYAGVGLKTYQSSVLDLLGGGGEVGG